MDFNERLERLERLAAGESLTSQRPQSAPLTPPWQSASPNPYLFTPPLRAGKKRHRADDDSGDYGVGQSEPAAKKSRLDDGSRGDYSAAVGKPRETNEDGHQSEERSNNNSVLAETNEEDNQSEDNSDGDFDDDSDNDSDLADFNDEDSDTLDVTAPFEEELQKEVSKASSAPSKDPITSEPTKVGWASSMQLTIYRENVAKIAEDFLKANNIKLGTRRKIERSVKDKKQYAQGVRDSKKIDVRGSRIVD